MAAETHKVSNQDSYEIELEKTPAIESTGEFGFPRSVYFLETYYDSAFRAISVMHDSLGETNIYILDSLGQIVCQSYIHSTSYRTDTIYLPEISGVYSIVIESKVVYAYGSFSL